MSTSLKKTAITEDQDVPQPLRFERRQIDRWPADGAATAFELAGEGFGRMHALHMLDCSHDGMAAVSDSVVAPGTTVSVGFQAPGYIAKRGTVARCQPAGDGYRVAIIFERRMAA